MPFGKAKRTVAQDVQALDHVREELLALRGEVTALRTEKRLKDAFIGRDEADMKKRLEGLTDVAHNAMQKAWALQKHNECMQRDLDLANSNRYLSEGYRPPVCMGCNGDQEVAYGPCGHIVFCSPCASRHVTNVCPICRTTIQTSLRVYRV